MLELKRYVPEGRVSTGLLAWWNGSLVWAVAQQKYWRRDSGNTCVPLIGIGGGQEDGESLPQTVVREAFEEANAAVSLLGAEKTLWVNGNGQGELKDLSSELAGEPAPLLIWQQRVSLRRDDGTPYDQDYINAVYQAHFLEPPTPGAEIPGLLFISPDSFRGLSARPIQLAELYASGVAYTGCSLPADTVIKLQGSALYLAEYWGRLAPGAGHVR